MCQWPSGARPPNVIQIIDSYIIMTLSLNFADNLCMWNQYIKYVLMIMMICFFLCLNIS